MFTGDIKVFSKNEKKKKKAEDTDIKQKEYTTRT